MLTPMFIGGVGGPELVILFMLVVLLFGANKLPKLARASGEAMGEFQKGREQIESEIRDAGRTTTAPSVDADGESNVDAAVDEAIDATVEPEFEIEPDHDASSA